MINVLASNSNDQKTTAANSRSRTIDDDEKEPIVQAMTHPLIRLGVRVVDMQGVTDASTVAHAKVENFQQA